MFRYLKTVILVLLFTILAACSKTEQEGNVHYAIKQYSECEFSKAASAAQAALQFGSEDIEMYTLALLIKGKSLMRLGEISDINEYYNEIIRLNSNVNTIQDAEVMGNNLDDLARICDELPS